MDKIAILCLQMANVPLLLAAIQNTVVLPLVTVLCIFIGLLALAIHEKSQTVWMANGLGILAYAILLLNYLR